MAFGLGGERCYVVGTEWWCVCEKGITAQAGALKGIVV